MNEDDLQSYVMHKEDKLRREGAKNELEQRILSLKNIRNRLGNAGLEAPSINQEIAEQEKRLNTLKSAGELEA